MQATAEEASRTTDWIQPIPDWISAIGVIAALGIAAYQLWQQRKDAKDSARRHEQAEKDAGERHAREMVDRRRERLLAGYSTWCEAAISYLWSTQKIDLATAEAAVLRMKAAESAIRFDEAPEDFDRLHRVSHKVAQYESGDIGEFLDEIHKLVTQRGDAFRPRA